MVSRAVLLRPARDVTRPSVQHLRAVQAPRPAVTQPPPSDGHSVAVLTSPRVLFARSFVGGRLGRRRLLAAVSMGARRLPGF